MGKYPYILNRKMKTEMDESNQENLDCPANNLRQNMAEKAEKNYESKDIINFLSVIKSPTPHHQNSNILHQTSKRNILSNGNLDLNNRK